MNLLQQLRQEEQNRLQSNKSIPNFSPGDTVVVGVKVVDAVLDKEGKIKKGESKSRIQNFEGVVIAKRNRGLDSSFIVRKIASGVGVERTFQLYSPLISSIELKRRGAVRRAKLYYLRERSGRSARIREKLEPRSTAPASAAQKSTQAV